MFDEIEFRELIRQAVQSALEEKIDDLRSALLETNSMYMTRRDVSQELRIGMSTVDYWVRAGRLRKHKLGKGAVRFLREEVEALSSSLDASKRDSNNDK